MRFDGWIWRLLVAAALLYFLVRGPWRALQDSGDFLTVFAASRCLIHGMNPYAVNDLVECGRAAGAPVSADQLRAMPSVYPPPALLLLSPLALFPWNLAKIAWLGCSLAASLWGAMGIGRLAKSWMFPSWTSLLLLAFAPLHTGMSKGQPSVLVCALIIGSVAVPQPYVAGALLGLAACIKPQLALGFLCLALIRQEGRKLASACATALLFCGVALAWLKPGSLPALLAGLSQVATGSGVNSGSAENLYRFQLINVETIIPQVSNSLVLLAAIYAILAVVSFMAIRKADSPLALAVVASATVLIGYHRFYDAQILWLAVPALLAVQRRVSLALSLLFAVFLVPGQTMAATWFTPQANGLRFFLLLHHETLACVALWLIFSGVAIRQHRRLAQPALAEART